jgi:hypothetical protein
MKVFLIWSGTRSKEVAEALKEWLPDVLQIVVPFVSSADIEIGSESIRALRMELSESNFGILCLTRDNCRKPWVLFEGGALSKVLDNSLCPYLIDMEAADLPDPLKLFEAATADEKGTRELIRALNGASKSLRLSEPQIRRSFDRLWPELKPKLESKAKPRGPAAGADTFLFINVKTESLLRAGGRPRKNGGPLETGVYSGHERETWTLHQVERRYYAIVSAHTGHCLDVEGSSPNEGVKIHQWEYQDGDNQKWTLLVQKDGSYRVRNKHSDRYLAATPEGIRQMGEADSRSQRWRIAPVFGM